MEVWMADIEWRVVQENILPLICIENVFYGRDAVDRFQNGSAGNGESSAIGHDVSLQNIATLQWYILLLLL